MRTRHITKPTGPDRPNRTRRIGAILALGLATATLAGTGQTTGWATAAATTRHTAADRVSSPPNVTFPVASSGHPSDRLTFVPGRHNTTDIAAACGTGVVAAHPGTVRVNSSAWAGGTLVRVFTTRNHLTTWYAFLRSVSVSNNQIVQAGQSLGVVGDGGEANGCELGFQVRNNSGRSIVNPSTWLNAYVGKKVPVTLLFGNRGFTLATLNMLGATHTDNGGDAAKRYPGYTTRLPKEIAILNSYGVDVAGLQEFQKPQHAMFLQRAGSTYGVYPPNQKTDTENSIIWRKSSFDLVEGNTFPVTYFNGSTRHMPYLLLRQKSTGLTAYFINVHNPANTYKYHHQENYRARAIAAERALIIKLRASGRPVFLTGDLNDRAAAYCPLADGKLMLAANTVPSMTCAPPPSPWIDWVLAAGPARFTTYVRDWATRNQKATDHPIVVSRTYLAG